MIYKRMTLKQLEEEGIKELSSNRPKIKNRRVKPDHHQLLTLLFKEIGYGTSVTKLYAGLLAKAIIEQGGKHMKRTYGPRLKELS